MKKYNVKTEATPPAMDLQELFRSYGGGNKIGANGQDLDQEFHPFAEAKIEDFVAKLLKRNWNWSSKNPPGEAAWRVLKRACRDNYFFKKGRGSFNAQGIHRHAAENGPRGDSVRRYYRDPDSAPPYTP